MVSYRAEHVSVTTFRIKRMKGCCSGCCGVRGTFYTFPSLFIPRI